MDARLVIRVVIEGLVFLGGSQEAGEDQVLCPDSVEVIVGVFDDGAQILVQCIACQLVGDSTRKSADHGAKFCASYIAVSMLIFAA